MPMTMDNGFIIKHALGITVVHLEALLRESDRSERHTPADFHLHILFFSGQESHSFGAICLDTNDISVESGELTDRSQLVRTLSFDLARRFIDRINSCVTTGKLERETVFQRATPELWEVYNRLKEDTFVDSLRRIQVYVPFNHLQVEENDPSMVGESVKVDTEDYSWARIHLSEERTALPK